ncbi:MAG: ABC transporter permease subunit [Rhodospirillaceae bacterium]|nr:ABC transporter permease subunit [Rhodospirillaceae bacterium]
MTRLSPLSLIYGGALVGLTFVIVSLAGNVIGSLTSEARFDDLTLDAYRRLLSDPGLPATLMRTLALGFGSICVTLAFALPFAWLLARTDFSWKTGLFTLLAAKLAIPGFITAMAYVWLFNPSAGLVNAVLGQTNYTGEAAFDVYQIKWLCLLQGLVLVPGAAFMLIPALRNLDGSLEEAARVAGVPGWKTFRHIVLPLLAPGVLAVAVFYFVVAVEMFDFVAIIAPPGDVLVLTIYEALNTVDGLPDYGLAGAAGVLLFALSAGAILFYVRFLRQARKYAVLGGKRRDPGLVRLGKWQRAATALVVLWVTLSVGLPVITLLWVAVVPFIQPPSLAAFDNASLYGFLDGFSYLKEPLTNTAIVMAGTITMALTFAICLTWVVTRSRSTIAPWADALVFLAPAVPAIVTATAFQVMGIAVYQWLPLYGTLWLIMAAMGTRMLAYCTRTMNAAALQIHPELEEAAWVAGLSRWRTFTGVFLPLMAPAIFYAALMVGMLAARDLTLPLIMNSAGTPLVSVLIFDLQTNGETASAAAVALYMIVVLVLLALTARKLTGVAEPGLEK